MEQFEDIEIIKIEGEGHYAGSNKRLKGTCIKLLLSSEPNKAWCLKYESSGGFHKLVDSTVEGTFIFVQCSINEIGYHLPSLHKKVASTNRGYREDFERREEISKKMREDSERKEAEKQNLLDELNRKYFSKEES
jgi:hypothetical protein